ncbi:MAG: trypsin-like serine protease [Bacteriovoracia bacterium]
MPHFLRFALSQLLCLFLFISAASADASDFRSLIENGNGVPRGGALASTVAMLTYGNGSFCSASFLSPQTLITAGHCAAGVRPGSMTVSVMNPRGGYYKAKAVSLAVHPEYSNRRDQYGITIIRNDLAIIQLSTPFPAPVRPVALSAFPQLDSGKWIPVTDVGYGFHNGHTGGMTLRWGKMLGQLQAIEQFDGRVGLEQKNSHQQNVCPGDSGGAVLLGSESSRALVAIHSLGNGCGSGPSTGASSELVWPARNWIRAQIH